MIENISLLYSEGVNKHDGMLCQVW